MTGDVPGRDARERAVRLAGALAEMGVTRLVVEAGWVSREVRARETDLPEVVLRSLGAVIASPELGIEVEIGSERLVWRARDEAAAAMMGAALGNR